MASSILDINLKLNNVSSRQRELRLGINFSFAYMLRLIQFCESLIIAVLAPEQNSFAAIQHFSGFTQYTDLTYPLTCQAILTDGFTWQLFAYQLNTIDILSHWMEDDLPANILWASKPQQLIVGSEVSCKFCVQLPLLILGQISVQMNSNVSVFTLPIETSWPCPLQEAAFVPLNNLQCTR